VNEAAASEEVSARTTVFRPARMVYTARMFELSARGTTVARELRGAVATFLTMAYILVANPAILSGAGVPFEAAAAATAASAAICTLLMGLGANFPLALAPGMGLNALVAFQLAPQTGGWQTAMGLIVLDGLVVLALVLVGVREAVLRAIPLDLRRAISVGIGLFIAFIGLGNARLVVVPPGTVAALGANALASVPPLSAGNLHADGALVAMLGVIVIAILLVRKTPGAILIGMAVSTAAALALGLAHVPDGSWLRVPRFDTMLAADVTGAMRWQYMPLLLSIVMVDFFDTLGTVTAVAETGQLENADGRIPRLRAILGIDAVSASIGGLLGASSVTSYIESAAGVADGARTGLHSVFVALLFGACVFAAPVMAMVPAAATAPALIMVGFLMCEQVGRIDFGALDTAIPAFIILLTLPLTYSISHGIGFGFIAFVVIKLARGRAADVHPVMAGSALAFLAFFALS
jgi:AGZA family xanthine/uracil permease-like MFS transporter